MLLIGDSRPKKYMYEFYCNFNFLKGLEFKTTFDDCVYTPRDHSSMRDEQFSLDGEILGSCKVTFYWDQIKKGGTATRNRKGACERKLQPFSK